MTRRASFLNFDAQIKKLSATAESKFEVENVRLLYMLLGYVRLLEHEIGLLNHGELPEHGRLQVPIWPS